MDAKRQASRPVTVPARLAPLADARFIGALGLLILNDHVLKAQYGNWLTGKASDLVGLIVLPILATVMLGLVRVPRAAPVAFTVVGVWFAAMKTVPAIARATERLAESITGTSSSIVVDPTDLVGLVGLVVAAAVLRSPRPVVTNRNVKVAVFAVGLVACTATSSDGGTPRDLSVNSETGEVTWTEYYDEFIGDEVSTEEVNGDEASAPASDKPALLGLGEFATEACLDAADGGDCFRISEGRVERDGGSGDWGVEWALFDNPFVFRAVGGGGGYTPSLHATDIAVSGGGEVFVAFDGIRPVMRDTAGNWSPPASDYRPIAAMLAITVLGMAGLALAVLRRRRGAIVLVTLLVGGAAFASLSIEDLFSALIVAGGVVASGVALFVGLIQASGIKRRVTPRQMGLAAAGPIVGAGLLILWKYVVAAPSWLLFAAPIIAAALAVSNLAFPQPLPPPPTPASTASTTTAG